MTQQDMNDERLIPLRVSEGWTISYNQFRADDLKESLLQAQHTRRDRLLDLGWYPEDDPEGAFRLVLHVTDFTGEELYARTFKRRSEVIPEIERLFDAVTRGQI